MGTLGRAGIGAVAIALGAAVACSDETQSKGARKKDSGSGDGSVVSGGSGGGGSGGVAGGGMGGDGGVGGRAGAAGTDAGPFACETMVCAAPPSPLVQSCCTDADRCGLEVVMFPTGCMALDDVQVGTPDSDCPSIDFQTETFAGCCRDDGVTCGSSAEALGLGCVDPAVFGLPTGATCNGADASADAPIDAVGDVALDTSMDAMDAMDAADAMDPCAPPVIDPGLLADAGMDYVGPAPDLYWTFDDVDVTGSTLGDVSPSGDDAAIAGGVTTGAPGRIGEAFDFDGATGIVTGMPIEPQDFTVSVWLAPTAYATGNGLIAVNHGVGPIPWSGWLVAVGNTGQLRFAMEGGTPAQEIVAGTQRCVPLGSWTHFVGIKEGMEIRVYRDGVLEETLPLTYSTIPYNSGGMELGRHAMFINRYYAGRMDDLVLWNAILTDQQIVQLYLEGVAGRRVYP